MIWAYSSVDFGVGSGATVVVGAGAASLDAREGCAEECRQEGQQDHSDADTDERAQADPRLSREWASSAVGCTARDRSCEVLLSSARGSVLRRAPARDAQCREPGR